MAACVWRARPPGTQCGESWHSTQGRSDFRYRTGGRERDAGATGSAGNDQRAKRPADADDASPASAGSFRDPGDTSAIDDFAERDTDASAYDNPTAGEYYTASAAGRQTAIELNQA